MDMIPCPFCGGKAIVNVNAGNPYIYCERCDVRQTPFDSLAEAETAWNRRAHPVTVEMLERWETTATAYPWISEAEFLTEIRAEIATMKAMK